jgi:cobalamin biosynthesis Mg chelatase CobN
MQHHQIASLTRSTALMACVAALMFALAGPAQARSDTAPQLSENSGQQAQPEQPTQLSENSGQQAQPAQPTQLSEHSGQQAQPPASTSSIVGDTPSDRVSPTAAPPAGDSSTTTADDSDDNAPLIVGVSILTVALLGSGLYVARRRRHVAPGH